MDPNIVELREKVNAILKTVEDTNRQVRKMRRSAAWGRFFQLAWWLIVVVVSGAAYYYYLDPYVKQIEKIYTQYGVATSSQPGFTQMVEQYFQNLSAKK